MVEVGQSVKKNQALFVLEAMKMESTVNASEAGKVKRIALAESKMVFSDDLVIELE